jgi:lipopolysaccharide transport system ATP-binding protein
LNSNNTTHRKWDFQKAPGDNVVKLLEVRLTDQYMQNISIIDFNTGGFIEYTYQILEEGFHPVPNIHIFDKHDEYVFVATANQSDSYSTIGTYTSRVKLPPDFLNDSSYTVGVAISTFLPNVIHFYEKEALKFEVLENMERRQIDYRGKMPGVLRPLLEWEIKKK